MRLLTVSEMKCYHGCPRHHHLRYGLGYRPVGEASPLRFGKAMHTGLEAWLQSGEHLGAAIEAVRPRGGDYDPFELVKIEELLMGYHARWAGSGYEVLAVEQEFRTPLLNPETGYPSQTFELGGKIDGIVRDSFGRVWIIEHKTTSEDVSTGSKYWLRLQIDSQVSTYMVGARALGYDVVGVLYDVIHKPTIRPYSATPMESRKYTKAGALYAGQHENDQSPEEFRDRLRNDILENPDKYYQRGEVVRLEADELDAAADAWQTAKQMRDSERLNRHPRHDGACVRWGRDCEFFPVCSRTAVLDDPTMYRKAEQSHEELSAEVQT